jgi:hypothetical protein
VIVGALGGFMVTAKTDAQNVTVLGNASGSAGYALSGSADAFPSVMHGYTIEEDAKTKTALTKAVYMPMRRGAVPMTTNYLDPIIWDYGDAMFRRLVDESGTPINQTLWDAAGDGGKGCEYRFVLLGALPFQVGYELVVWRASVPLANIRATGGCCNNAIWQGFAAGTLLFIPDSLQRSHVNSHSYNIRMKFLEWPDGWQNFKVQRQDHIYHVAANGKPGFWAWEASGSQVDRVMADEASFAWLDQYVISSTTPFDRLFDYRNGYGD